MNNWYILDDNNDKGCCVNNEPQPHRQYAIQTILWLPNSST